VDLVVQLDAARLPFAACLGDRLERLVPLDKGVRAEAEFAQQRERLGLRLAHESLARTDAVHPYGQRPRGGDRGILLAERAGGGVSWVGRDLLLRPCEALVELAKAGERHVHLPTDL